MTAAPTAPESTKEAMQAAKPAVARARRGAGTVAAGAKAAQNERALSLLTDLCSTLNAGERLPLHIDLMRRFDVSERAILRAFDELQRIGRIIRKPGLGTIIAERGDSPTTPIAALGAGVLAGSLPVWHGDPRNHSTDGSVLAVPSWAIVAVAHADHSFFERCLDRLCTYADDAGIAVFCKPLRIGEQPAVGRLGAMSINPAICRFVFFGNSLMPLAKQIQDMGGRAVVVGTPLIGSTSDVPRIYGNQDFGGYLITQNLIETDHSHIGFFHYDAGISRSLRWQGHQRALREARRRGIAVKDSLIVDVLSEWEADPSLAARYFRGEDTPDALVLWNDREAIRMLAVLQKAGVRVPEDVSVAGYDNLPDGKLAHPALLTVDPGIDHQLRAAVDMLSEPDAPEGGRTSVVIPTLVERDLVAQKQSRPLPIA